MQADTAQPIADAWVEIDLDRMRGNLAAIRDRLPAGCRYCAVLKADAYGHGIDRVAPVLVREGVDFAAITDNADVFALRRAGFAGRIMRLRGAAPEEARQVRGLGVEELATGAAAARALADPDDPAPVHLPINAGGMGRDGLELTTEHGRAEAREILGSPGLRVVGLATHFPINTPDELTGGRARFEAGVEWCLREGGLDREKLLLHAASSLGLVAAPAIATCIAFDMVRAGAALWGIVGPRGDFSDVMALRARITSVNRLPAGASVGYDRIARLGCDSRVANVSIGYANGVRRAMADRAQVAVRGRIAPLIGKISMNALTVDVTDIPDAQAGDTVTLFGRDGDAQVTRAMVEEATGTIMADLYCDWGRSNRRAYRAAADPPWPHDKTRAAGKSEETPTRRTS